MTSLHAIREDSCASKGYISHDIPRETQEKKEVKKGKTTNLPVFSSGKTSNLTQVLLLHQLILSQLADGVAIVALHGGTTAGERTRFFVVQTVQRTVHTARRGGRRGLLRAFGRTQSSGNVQGALKRT
jgi:hypothetical protein